MACRVRVRLRRGSRCVETSALVNSGFESDEPDVVVPVEVARALGLWPPPDDVELAELGTGGGDLAAPYYRKAEARAPRGGGFKELGREHHR